MQRETESEISRYLESMAMFSLGNGDGDDWVYSILWPLDTLVTPCGSEPSLSFSYGKDGNNKFSNIKGPAIRKRRWRNFCRSTD